MSADRPFFDTNVVLYLLSDDAAKADRAEGLIAEGGVISVQVLNEFAAVASRKLHLDWAEIDEILATLRSVFEVLPLTVELHKNALRLAARYGYTIYDSLIVATALEAGSSVLFSEDMHSGQRIEGLQVRNPFAEVRR